MATLVTGGAGFIGANLVDRLLNNGREILILDDLSRPGSKKNLSWLRERHAERTRFVKGSVTDFDLCQRAMADIDAVYHLAGQTAVTTSVNEPRHDFEVNALGTFNILEAARLSGNRPRMLFASTNKVYGALDGLAVLEGESRYQFADHPFGISEEQPLDFHSPYGCSKGAADQYVRDYSRMFDLPTVVLRQSCIYGPRQMGVEDQGWLAWFIIALVMGKPISIYGTGKQVRDVLHVDDLLTAFESAESRIESISGEIFNIGGGSAMTISVWWEFMSIIEEVLGREIPAPIFEQARPGDQPIYISDVRKAERLLDWTPTIAPATGIADLTRWVQENRELFAAC